MKEYFKNSKKGELTTQQIVLLIILLVGFIVVLYFLFRLNLGKESDIEVCHNSVIMRGSSVVPTDAIPLKCSRSYICITKDGSCEKMTKPEIKKVKTEEEIYEVLAEEMANCWWMFGEGKVNYVGKDFKENLYCSICSQISFDNSLEEIEGMNGEISQQKFYSFLEKKQMQEKGQSYLYYLTGYSNMNSFQSYVSTNGIDFRNLDLNKQYFILTGITSEVGVWKWAGIGAAGLGLIAAPFTGGASLGISALIIGGSVTAGGIGGYFVGTAVKGEGVDNEFLKPMIIEASSDVFSKLNCKDVLTTA